MNGYNMMEERKKFRIIVPVISLLAIICIFLPFMSWEAAGINLTGFEALKKCFSGPGEITVIDAAGNAVVHTSVYAFGRILILLPIIFALIGGILPAVLHKRFAYRISMICFAAGTLCNLIALFTVAKKMNLLITPGNVLEKVNATFLVKYMQIGFWLILLFNILGIAFSLVASKTSTAYMILITMSVVWILPILWVVMTSFRGEKGSYTPYFWPKTFTFDNYVQLFTDTSQFYFLRWFLNTLVVAIFSCILTTFFVLSTAFVLSRLRFKTRKLMMNVMLVLGMFPGFMSMIAVYYILKAIGLSQSLASLVLVYSGGAMLGYYIAKGFFDTIPKALDEAAIIDGATKWGVYTKITIPLSKPIIIYTVLTSFTSPWMDFIFARVIMGDNYKNYTVALGLWTMLQREFITTWYTRFAAGAVIVSIPIAILFVIMQKYYVEGLSGGVKG